MILGSWNIPFIPIDIGASEEASHAEPTAENYSARYDDEKGSNCRVRETIHAASLQALS